MIRPPTRLALSLFAVTLVPALRAQTIEEVEGLLAAAESYDDDAVGYAGIETDTWKAFARLRELATADRLRELTGHDSAIVRCYAVRALAEAHADVPLLPILVQHWDDLAEVWTFRGCIRARQKVGDVMVGACLPRLSPEHRQDLATALVRTRSALDSRGSLLRTIVLPDGLLHELRAMARDGDDDALVALARFRLAPDLEILLQRVGAGRRLRDQAVVLQACALCPDPRLLVALQAIEGEVRRTLRTDTGQRARHWLAAIAAHENQAAADYLTRFVASDAVPASRRASFEKTLREVLAGHDEAVFAALRERLGTGR